MENKAVTPVDEKALEESSLCKKIITVASQKGGSGKTTTVLALAQYAVKNGLKVLCIDLDAQRNLTQALDSQSLANSVYMLIEEESPLEKCIEHTGQGIDLIRGSFEISSIMTSNGSGRRLSKALDGVLDSYDLVLIDTPPSVGEIQFNALRASTDLVIVIGPSLFDLQGMYLLIDIAKAIQKKGNPDLKITGYILTNFDGRSKLARKLEEDIDKQASSEGVSKLGTVRQAVAVRESQSFGKSLFDYAPKSKVASDYKAVFENLMSK